MALPIVKESCPVVDDVIEAGWSLASQSSEDLFHISYNERAPALQYIYTRVSFYINSTFNNKSSLTGELHLYNTTSLFI